MRIFRGYSVLNDILPEKFIVNYLINGNPGLKVLKN